jgi:hypothetical protein
MAKNGFSMSNRVAVESVSAAKTLTADDCGKLFVVTATGSAGYTLSLPAAATAGEGWNVSFNVISGSVAKTVTIDPNGSETVYVVGISAVSSSQYDEVIFAEMSDIAFKDTNVATGDRLRLVCDGTNWWAETYLKNEISGTLVP